MRGFPVQGDNCYLSCGLGVQSYTLINMSIRGVIPKFKAALFADTGWERQSTYDLIEGVSEDCAEAGIDFYVVNNGSIRDDIVNPDHAMPALPFHINTTHRLTIEDLVEEYIDSERVARIPSPDSIEEMETPEFNKIRQSIEQQIISESERYRKNLEDMSPERLEKRLLRVGSGMARRQCTGDYKIKPIREKLDEIEPNMSFRNPIQMALGISLDEFGRAKPSRIKMIQHCYPLIDLGWKRADCLRWLENEGLTIPDKSSCIGCPFHSNYDWRQLNEEEFADVVEVEAVLHDKGMKYVDNSKDYIDNKMYFHPSLRSVSERPFDKKEQQETLFGNEECSGHCHS